MLQVGMQRLVWGGSSRFGCYPSTLIRKFSTNLAAEPVLPAGALTAVQSSSPPPISPLLMLPSGWVDDDDSNNCHLFSVAEDEVIKIKKNFDIPWRRHYLYPERDIHCYGSSGYGWQALVNKQTCKHFLFNPLGNPLEFSHTIIPLPPLESLYDCFSSFHTIKTVSTTPTSEFVDVDSVYNFTRSKYPYTSEDMIERGISKLVLSSPPLTATTYNEDCFLMASTQLRHGRRYVCCRPGDTSWTSLNFVGEVGGTDADFTYFSKDQLFYSLTTAGVLESLDLRRPNSKNMRSLVYNCLPPIIQPTMDEEEIELRVGSGQRYHLVDSCGELLLVVRYIVHEYVFTDCNVDEEKKGEKKECAVAFDVYKFDFEQKKWVYVPDLGDDRVLFLGVNSFSMSLSDNPGLEESISGNSIYYSFGKDRYHDPSYNDSGVYDLNDGSNTTILPECFSSKENQIQTSPPMWIHPQQ